MSTILDKIDSVSVNRGAMLPADLLAEIEEFYQPYKPLHEEYTRFISLLPDAADFPHAGDYIAGVKEKAISARRDLTTNLFSEITRLLRKYDIR